MSTHQLSFCFDRNYVVKNREYNTHKQRFTGNYYCIMDAIHNTVLVGGKYLIFRSEKEAREVSEEYGINLKSGLFKYDNGFKGL